MCDFDNRMAKVTEKEKTEAIEKGGLTRAMLEPHPTSHGSQLFK